MGHFDPLPAKTRGHLRFKGVNESKTRNLHTTTDSFTLGSHFGNVLTSIENWLLLNRIFRIFARIFFTF